MDSDFDVTRYYIDFERRVAIGVAQNRTTNKWHILSLDRLTPSSKTQNVWWSATAAAVDSQTAFDSTEDALEWVRKMYG